MWFIDARINNLQKGNVFSHDCLFTGGGVGVASLPMVPFVSHRSHGQANIPSYSPTIWALGTPHTTWGPPSIGKRVIGHQLKGFLVCKKTLFHLIDRCLRMELLSVTVKIPS